MSGPSSYYARPGGPSFPVPSYAPDQSAPPLTPWHGPRSTGLPSSRSPSGSPGYDLAYSPSVGPISPPVSRSIYPVQSAQYGPHSEAYPPSNGRFSGSDAFFPSPHISAQPPTPGSHPSGRSSHGGYGGGYGYAPPAMAPPLLPASPQRHEPRIQIPAHQHRLDDRPSQQRSGKRRALLIGINYYGQDSQLQGCVNDVWDMSSFLMEHNDFREKDIMVLTDEGHSGVSLPTRSNMLKAMEWLVRDARPGDAFFFHFAGHGDRQEDLDGDEADGWDEAVCPLDYKSEGSIIDDDMHRILVKPLPAGCRLTAIFDCCYSGSALDLPYIYSTEDKATGLGILRHIHGNRKRASNLVQKGLIKSAVVEWRANRRARRTKTSPADVFSWAACMDSQLAAEPVGPRRSTGVMSHAFVAVLTHSSGHTYQSLLAAIRGYLGNKYSQRPLLSSSHPMDMGLQFII